MVEVVVRDNNVDQALRALKKKMQREGLFREMKMRRHYEKPSEARVREQGIRADGDGQGQDTPGFGGSWQHPVAFASTRSEVLSIFSRKICLRMISLCKRATVVSMAIKFIPWKKKLYLKGDTEPFKLSRSKIDLFLECARCFYVDNTR